MEACAAAEQPERAALGERLAAAVKARVGVSATRARGRAGIVERSGGKAKRMVAGRVG